MGKYIPRIGMLKFHPRLPPAAGHWNWTSISDVGNGCYYWSSSLATDSPDNAFFGGFRQYGGYDHFPYAYRHYGYSVRPVCD